MRSAVIIVENGKVALIRRIRNGQEYFLFPGGQVEENESIEDAARREAHEELGVTVQLGKLVAERKIEPLQSFFSASIVDGEFGTGAGEEYALPSDSDRGTYHPVWVKLTTLDEIDIRPRSLACSVVENLNLPQLIEVLD
jgi:8-oxo-dGTP diphosphatase